MLTALLTRAVSAVVENVRATIIREKQSRMAQQYTLPSRAGCSVMSVHHNSLGLVAVNRRFTRSSGVLTLIRFGMPRPVTRPGESGDFRSWEDLGYGTCQQVPRG